MARLLLIANANARSVTPYKREVIARALSAEFKVDVVQTDRPGHAADLAREAALDGIEVVVAMGGDGTVNEVANGLAGSATSMAVLPAGGVNVFARSLGIPDDAVEATGRLLQRAAEPPRPIGLGRVNGRYFTMSCGVGLDGAIVRQVERRQLLKKTAGDLYYMYTGLRMFFFTYGRRRPRIRLSWGEDFAERRDGLHLAIVQKDAPYTYLGTRPMHLTPGVIRERGLDCLALSGLKTRTVFRVIASSFGRGHHARSRHVVLLQDLPALRIDCDEPLPVQTDGEFIGEHLQVLVESVPRALLVTA